MLTGQVNDGTACGAACGALNYCIACSQPDATKSIPVPGQNPADYQMEYIISEVICVLKYAFIFTTCVNIVVLSGLRSCRYLSGGTIPTALLHLNYLVCVLWQIYIVYDPLNIITSPLLTLLTGEQAAGKHRGPTHRGRQTGRLGPRHVQHRQGMCTHLYTQKHTLCVQLVCVCVLYNEIALYFLNPSVTVLCWYVIIFAGERGASDQL